MFITTRRWRDYLSLAVLALPCLTHDAAAVSLVPMEMEFSTSGRAMTRLFRIENVSAETAAVEISAKARRMLPDGQDELSDADDEFAIYPQQMILKPGQAQAIRVQWLGKEVPSHELAYRLIAEQLPLDRQTRAATGPAPIGAQGVQIRVLMKYVASLYVVPPGARAAIVPISAERVTIDDQPQLRLVLENRGSAHQLLLAPRLTVSGTDGTGRALEKTEVQALVGANLLAHSQRVFYIPLPASLPTGLLRLSLTDAAPAAAQRPPPR